MSDKTRAPSQRLDKWLWCARVVRSRTLAAQLIGGGKVRVLEVLAVPERRGPAQEAKLLYREVAAGGGR